MADRGVPPPERLRPHLGWLPERLEPLGGGRNSQVFRVAGAGGREAALKVYFRHPGDGRDRLGTEFGALSFCWDRGLRDIPRPLAAVPGEGFALYEFIAGEPAGQPTPADLDQAARFLGQLRRLGGQPMAATLPAASEACFSFRSLAGNIDARLERLAAAAAGHPDLDPFLREALLPAWRILRAGARDACARAGLGFDLDLPPGARTLSPSDFGFHNAVRRDGSLVFLDFEYFGWDDPAKTLADLLLHPGMDLPPESRRGLARAILRELADVPDLGRRARIAYPLYGLKWCLILLNEFLPTGRDRRAFADPGGPPEPERQARQLAKSRCKLEQILDPDEHALPLPS